MASSAHNPRPGGGSRRGAVAVLLGQIFGHALGKAAGIAEAGVDELQAARPAQSPFAADFVGKAESQRPLVRLWRG